MQTLFFRPWRRSAALALGWALASMAAHAQTPHTPAPDPAAWSLRALFDHAWQRQPEAQAQPLRQQAAEATRLAAQRWTAEPPALQLQTRTDRPGSQQGQREVEVGLAAPLWLPGERARSAALGDAQWQQVQSQQRAAQWQLAAQVRQAWWDWQRARSDLALAQDRLHSARQLAADVQRRWQAGDLARTDGLQAQAVVAQAEAAQAEAQGALQAGLLKGAHWQAYLPALVLSIIGMGGLLAMERRGRLRAAMLLSIGLILLVQVGLGVVALGGGMPSLWGLGALLFVFFCGFNMLEATQPSLVSRMAPGSLRGAALGAYNTLQSLGLFAGGALGGALAKWAGAPGLFAATALLAALWLALTWPLRPVAKAGS